MKVVSHTLRAIVIGYILVSMALSLLISIGVFRWELIAHRAPFVLVDVAFSEVEGIDSPDHKFGYDRHGEYIGFRSDVEIGDKVLSLMVFNPSNNYSDDIVERYDVAVWR